MNNKNKDGSGSFVSHIAELRTRLIKSFIFLLWKKHNKQGHYMSLYPKDYKNISNIVSKLLL